MSEEKKSHWNKYRLRYSLAGMFFLGGAGVLVFGPSGQWPAAYLEHLSMATSISGFIAFFLELVLHQQFAKNVFEASIGYLLPEELRGELRWIYNLPFLCEKHIQKVTIVRRNENTVTATIEVSRLVRNITSEAQQFTPGLGVPDWLHEDAKSKITSYVCRLEGQDEGPNLAQKQIPDGFQITLGTQEPIVIQREGKLRVSFTYEETLRDCDWAYLHFGTPTCDVSVVVDAPDDLGVDVRFSHRNGDPKVTKIAPHTWHLDGSLLPLQGIRVYWYRKDKYEKWRASFAGS